MADTRSSEYAIEMFLQGLALDPDNVAAHKELRVIALRRKADGGKDLGTLEKMKLKASLGKGDDHKQSMLKAEKLLAYNPGNVEWMISVATHASRAGFQNAADWFTEIARRAAGN